MAAFCRNPRFVISRTFFSTLSSSPSQNPSPPFPSFRALKSAIKSESNPEKLAEIFQNSSEFATFRRHRPLFHLSVRKLARSKRFDLIERILEHQHQHQHQKKSLSDSHMLMSEGFWIRVIMLYSNAGMVDHALRTFHQMEEHKCDRTEKSLCAILTVHLNNRMFDRVHQLFTRVPLEMDVSPGVASYNLVLKAFCQEKSIESARALLAKMEDEDEDEATTSVTPNIYSYNILLDAYLKSGDEIGFDGIVKEISKKGLEPNLTTYNHRILWFCKNKECVRAKKLLDEMVSRGAKPNSESYNTIIFGFVRVGDLESARKVLESMLADGYVSPCSFTYYTLIRHMVEEGEFESALGMCKEIIRRKWVPPFEAMEGLVNGLVKMSKVAEAKEIVEKMKKRLRGTAVDSWGKIEAALPL